MVRAQRYFFKEDNTMDNVDKLVDEVFDGGFNTFGKVRKAEKKIDMLLDGSMSVTGRPYAHPIQMKVVATVDGSIEINVDDNVGAQVEGEGLEECGMGPMMNEKDGFEDSEYDGGPEKPDDPKKVSNDINQVPNQNVAGLLKSVHAELGEGLVWKMVAEMRKGGAYKAYFRKALAKHGYKSPADIPADKKAAFFKAVDKGWTAANEQMMRRGMSGGDNWKHPMRRGSGGGSAYGAQAGGAGRKGGFGSIKGRKEQEDIEDDELEDKNNEVGDGFES